ARGCIAQSPRGLAALAQSTRLSLCDGEPLLELSHRITVTESATVAKRLFAARDSGEEIHAVHHLLPRHEVDEHSGAAAALRDEERLPTSPDARDHLGGLALQLDDRGNVRQMHGVTKVALRA